MKDLGDAMVRLGLEIECYKAQRKLWLTPSKYGSSVLVKLGMESCCPETGQLKIAKCSISKVVALQY